MKKSVYWIFAIVITLALSIYQRMTGPTYPQKVTIELRGESYQIKLPRSGVQQDEIVKLPELTGPVPMSLHYRQYPTTNDFTTVDFQLKDGAWQAALPVQPVAGKLQYYLTVDGKDYLLEKPLGADFAILGGSIVDESGNVFYRGTTKNFNPMMAQAADTVIVEAEKLVKVGEIEPEAVHTPALFVDYIYVEQ